LLRATSGPRSSTDVEISKQYRQACARPSGRHFQPEELGAEIPNLAPYDPAKDGRFPCEDEVAAAIEKLRAGEEAKDRKGG
jgi:hypothetical protein